MSTTIVGSNFISIAHAGTALFEQGPIQVGVGSVSIDLVSAPIPPGEYDLEIVSGVGSVEIYIPNYVQFTVNGGAFAGSTEIYEGLPLWERIGHSINDALGIKNRIPDHAVAPASSEQQVRIDLHVKTGFGSIEIYRLTPAPA